MTKEQIELMARVYCLTIHKSHNPTPDKKSYIAGAQAVLARAEELVKALESVVNWFDDVSKRQFEQLGQSLDKACDEWPDLYQGSLDVEQLKEALKKFRGES